MLLCLPSPHTHKQNHRLANVGHDSQFIYDGGKLNIEE